MAVCDTDGHIAISRASGKLDRLAAQLTHEPLRGSVGIGHTRWATHGRPSEENAHPHRYAGVAVVHNGIIENHLELRERLRKRGHTFNSETDTEIFAHLIADAESAHPETGLLGAVQEALAQVHGTYALAVLSE